MVIEMHKIAGLLRKVLEQPVISRDDADLTDGIRACESVMRLALAEQLRLVAEAERPGVFSRAGARNTKAWLQGLLRISGGEADARAKVARKVEDRTDLAAVPLPPDLPATACALREGAIGLEHARAIVDGVGKLPSFATRQERGDAESLLAAQARVLDPGEVRTLAERIRYQLDQDGALREEEHQVASRELHFGVARDGMTVLKGRLDRETGAKLRAALEPLAAPRPERDGEKDPRSAGRRHADAFADLLDIALSSDRLPRAGGQRPHLTVTIGFDELTQRLPFDRPASGGTVDTTGQPITAAQVRRLACDAEILPIILDGDGQPLDVGRSQRTAPPHLRAALLARDGTCSFPGCDHPPGTAEAHHLVHWADGGSTSLDNMINLCASHHRTVHTQRWDIDLSSGRPMFTPPHWIDPSRTPRPGNHAMQQHQLALSR
jgi:hypothetical protein